MGKRCAAIGRYKIYFLFYFILFVKWKEKPTLIFIYKNTRGKQNFKNIKHNTSEQKGKMK